MLHNEQHIRGFLDGLEKDPMKRVTLKSVRPGETAKNEHGTGQPRAPPNRPQPQNIQVKDYLVARKPLHKPRGGSRYRPLEPDDLSDNDNGIEVKASANSVAVTLHGVYESKLNRIHAAQ